MTTMEVAVVGGGRMGAGIAQVFAAAGYQVVIAERNEQAAEIAGETVRVGVSRAAERGALTDDPSAVVQRVRTVAGIGELPTSVELLIEALPEDEQLKQTVLRAADAVLNRHCLIATNTSSLSVTDLASAVTNPGRFIGMHFFNPVPVSAMVEVVVGPATTDQTVAATTRYVEQLGKQHIVVRDSPGFATSRLGVLLGLEAIRMLEEGVADAASIDTAMELGYRHPMGPLRSTDLVGLDVRLAIAEHLSRTLGDRFEPPDLLRGMVDRGELGRKSGRGFFVWS
jgi:3-hydroxybutyryl-CoA dehydrogenase